MKNKETMPIPIKGTCSYNGKEEAEEITEEELKEWKCEVNYYWVDLDGNEISDQDIENEAWQLKDDNNHIEAMHIYNEEKNKWELAFIDMEQDIENEAWHLKVKADGK